MRNVFKYSITLSHFVDRVCDPQMVCPFEKNVTTLLEIDPETVRDSSGFVTERSPGSKWFGAQGGNDR